MNECPECGLSGVHEISCSKYNVGQFDQIQANFMSTVPALWRNIFFNLKREGFDDNQALKLLIAYIHGSVGGKLT